MNPHMTIKIIASVGLVFAILVFFHELGQLLVKHTPIEQTGEPVALRQLLHRADTPLQRIGAIGNALANLLANLA